MSPAPEKGAPEKGAPPADLLAGMKVLSFCHYLQGPAAVQYLADMGADVIKIEPVGGAFERRMTGPKSIPEPMRPLFVAANRNKRSLAVDLKAADGRRIIERLIEDYDVIVENFRPGVMGRLGLGYEDVMTVNPDVIYASATGYGATGPMAEAPGQDLLLQAATGLMAASGRYGEAPTAAGAAVVDQHAASLLALGVLGAYVRRLTTGRGGRVENSLLNAGIDLQMEAITFYLNRGEDRGEGGFGRDLARSPNLATWYHPAPYGIYRVADGFIALSLTSTEALCAALRHPALDGLVDLDPFADRDRYAERVAQALAEQTYDAAAARLEAQGVWFARVATYEDLEAHPQVRHNAAFAQVEFADGTARVVNHPVRYDGAVPGIRRPPPGLGAHTRELMQGVGYSASEIDDLARRRIVLISDAGRSEASAD